MNKKERLNFIGTATLAGMLSLSSQAGFAQENQSENSDYEYFSFELSENDNYEIFLDAVSNYLKLEKCTELRNIFEQVKKDPESHIEIVDSNYLVYLIDENTGEKKPNWSIQFNHDKINKRGTIAVVIDKYRDYFKGDDNDLAALNEVPTNVLMTIADYAFNTPKEMQNIGWDIYGVENGLLYIDKEYIDDDKYEYFLRIREDNVIIFNAPYPLPLNKIFRSKENPILKEDSEEKI
jgi:hypothetical protein